MMARIRYFLLSLKAAGLGVTLSKLAHELYGRNFLWVIATRMEEPYPAPTFKCEVRQASSQEVEEFLQKLKGESKESRYKLLGRKWWHEQGIGVSYIAWAKDTDEMCAIRWAIAPRAIKEKHLEGRYPRLEEGDVFSEYAYVLEKYRGKGVLLSSLPQLWAIYRKQGYKRWVTWVDEDNISSLKALKKTGPRIVARVLRRHVFFRVTYSVLNQYDPPIDIIIPQE